MKRIIILIINVLSIIFIDSCNESTVKTHKKVILKEARVVPKTKVEHQEPEKPQPAVTDKFEIGDINNDSITDTAFVYTPPVIWGGGGNCCNTIRFSASLPGFTHDGSVWGSIESVGDLDKDGVAELLFSPGWFQSNNFTVYLYTLKEGKWKIIAKAHSRRDVLGKLKKKVVFINGYYYLRAIEFDADSFEGYKYYPVKIPLRVPIEDPDEIPSVRLNE